MASPCITPVFKALSALLTYPTEALVAAAPEIAALIASDRAIEPKARENITGLLADLEMHDLYDVQERYVDLFDKTRKLSLHLFEHVHGESRDRGQAMVDLAALYEKNGLQLAVNELPDYLPLFLEYLATRPLSEAQGLLGDTAHILAALEERLGKRQSSYAAVFAALRSLAGAAASADASAESAEADDLAAIDEAWEETAVTFGPGEGAAQCSAERLQTRLRAARREARA